MSDDDLKSLRRELTAACAKVRRQIDAQQRSASFCQGGAFRRGSDVATDELRDELDRLETALADLEPADAADGDPDGEMA